MDKTGRVAAAARFAGCVEILGMSGALTALGDTLFPREFN